jgi:16S rRNA (guanine527-N7)-methyltransferase
MSELVRELLLQSAADIGLELTPDKLEKFLLFADELKKWNKKFNLTAITDDRGLALKHFADSLLLLKVLGDSVNLLDIGSGGGFPSIPIKIVMPQLSVVSVDAVEKKILFQRHIARTLGFDEFTAVHARCEDLPSQYAGHFELIVSRAFSDLVSFADLAAPLLSKKGRMIAMKGKGGAEEASDSMSQLLRMGIAVTEIIDLRLPVSGEPRCFVVMEKTQK